MFTHVVLGTDNIPETKAFYDAVLGTIGINGGMVKPNGDGRVIYSANGQFFVITNPVNGKEATFGNGSTIGFKAESKAQVDEFYKVALEKGAVSETVPVKKNNGAFDLYVAHVRDLTGNKLCISFML